MKVAVYLSESGWCYSGVYQNIGDLPGITSLKRKLWTMLGALLIELANAGYKEITVYNDTDIIDEWNNKKQIENKQLAEVASKIKSNECKKFVSISIKKIDTFTLDKKFKELQLK